jgi:sulfur-oxidizing protein SoxA
MRCPSLARLAAIACSLAAVAAIAAPSADRDQVRERLQALLPGMSPADFALGSAAFDEGLRAQIEQNAGAASPVLEEGARIWKRKFRDGRSLASCFPNGGRRIAGAYPQFHPRLKLVMTLEMAINQCLKIHREALLETADPKTMGAVTAYLRSLSDGRRIAVRVPAGAQASFEQGRRFYFSRLGQRNFACASCHVQGAGKRYADAALSPAIGQATHWPVIRDGMAVSLQGQIRECLERMGAAPFPAGSEELNNLEYFLTYLSNGLAIKANAWRAPRAAP